MFVQEDDGHLHTEITITRSLPYSTTSHQTTPHHTTPHHTIPHHITPNHTTPHHTIPHHTTPHYTTSHHTTPHHTTLHHTKPHHTTTDNLQQLITSTVIGWATSDLIVNQALIRAMFSLLHRQYDGVYEVRGTLEISDLYVRFVLLSFVIQNNQ